MRTDIPQLRTKRFICRALQSGDEHAFWPAFSDPVAMRYWGREPFDTVEALRDWLFDPDWTGRTWIAVPSGGGDPVLRMVASEPNPQVGEIGYMVLPAHTRQGIARECVSALITHLFTAESFHRVFADTDPRNIASNRLLESLGFTREAHLRHAMKTHIGWCDTHLWGLLAEEWQPQAL